MFTKFVRFVVALAVMVSVVAETLGLRPLITARPQF